MDHHFREQKSLVLTKPNRRTILAGTVASGIAAIAGLPSRAKAAPTPEERIDAAMAEISAALAEQYPGWTIQTRHDVVSPQIYPSMERGEPCRAGVLIFATENRHGPETARWFVDYS